MKESKCGKMPPCYGSLERAIYEEAKKANDEWKKSRARHGKLIDKLRGKLMEGGFLDDTHDIVYGLNRQMCDLGKTMNDPMKPLSEEAVQEIAKALEITRNPKGIIMEEKKTKKMTKAEAFEYLKGKKVYVAGKSGEIQEVLFKAGFSWDKSSASQKIESTDAPFLYMGNEGSLMYGTSMEFFIRDTNEEISADDILSIEIVEEKSEGEDALDLISTVGARLSEVLRRMKGHKHVVITEDDVILYDEGMSLFHSDPF